MSVVSIKELARTFEREVGRPAIVKRRIVVVLSDDTTTGGSASFNDIVAAAFGSATFGISHPEFTVWKLRKVFVNEGYEGSPYHVEVVGEYGLVRPEEIQTPTARPSVWSVDGGQGEVPALFYYDGSGNGTTYALTNSAYDFFPGLMRDETTARITIQKNFAAFPTAWMAAMNFVNSDLYFGMPSHTAKVADVNTEYASEEFNNSLVYFWKTTATVIYRQSGHNFQLPDIGWNYIAGGQKNRAMVYDFENDAWVPSANPIGLNGSGGPSPTGYPAILPRRVNPETSFQTLFGTPPE